MKERNIGEKNTSTPKYYLLENVPNIPIWKKQKLTFQWNVIIVTNVSDFSNGKEHIKFI